MSVLQKLTEGIVQRDVSREGQEILNKWEATGLLEGLDSERTKQTMSVLLENQAKELLREASSMAAGDVEGFAAVAFPIVRRVFGGLIANELVSVQPMSLPSGLIFFLDFTKESARAGGGAGESLYGGDRVASQVTGGVDLTGAGAEQSFYNLATGYSNATGSCHLALNSGRDDAIEDGNISAHDYDVDLASKNLIVLEPIAGDVSSETASALGATGRNEIAQCDAGVPQAFKVTKVSVSSTQSDGDAASEILGSGLDTNGDLLVGLGMTQAGGFPAASVDCVVARLRQVRRQTRLATTSTNGLRTVTHPSKIMFEIVSLTDLQGNVAQVIAAANHADFSANFSGTLAITTAPATAADLKVLETLDMQANGGIAGAPAAASLTATINEGILTALEACKLTCEFPVKDNIASGNGLGALVGTDVWGLEEPSPGTGNNGSSVAKNTIAEIDIKVDSIAVTAQTKKLKAKWTPELAQDLNAYHNLDAEVELTGILSEQIALEIDQEILGDLVRGATAGTMYWSRRPGKFVDRTAGGAVEVWTGGVDSATNLLGADFTGTVSEWYETLVETINDVSAQIHRKTLRGGANFLVCGPEVANILEFTSGFRANITHDQERGTVGAVKAGSLSKKWDVYVDPYFMRNVILVGRKGSSFLESGFVYAPYVPLQTTPTIFGTEDFVPRKGVMTRYAKKMVRPDLYGLVIVQDLLG